MVNFIQKPSMSDWVGCWQSKAGKLLTHRGWNTNRYRYLRLIWNDILTNIFIWYKLTKLVDGCWRWTFHWQVWFPKCLVDCSFAIILFHWFFLTCTISSNSLRWIWCNLDICGVYSYLIVSDIYIYIFIICYVIFILFFFVDLISPLYLYTPWDQL